MDLYGPQPPPAARIALNQVDIAKLTMHN